MLCDNCRENDAVVTLTRPAEGGVVIVHLCEKCAAERGIQTEPAAKSSLTQLLMPLQKQLPSTPADAGRCTFCSSTLRDFRSTGRLGCPRCYSTFEPMLRDLLRKVHGNFRHVGKQYRAPEIAPSEGGSVLNELRERLRRAVESEQFELAAELRDRIKVLE
jgi:protein arginine kinase activator